jgi:hypothetical protein
MARRNRGKIIAEKSMSFRKGKAGGLGEPHEPRDEERELDYCIVQEKLNGTGLVL